ncbi:MAG: iron uptake porin [Scytolyngbya sp. HA4215-MV1]|nr:iron uptake porin [Scytolyngbya sp. HA4215-MV1]
MDKTVSAWKSLLVVPTLAWVALLAPAHAIGTEVQNENALPQSQAAASLVKPEVVQVDAVATTVNPATAAQKPLTIANGAIAADTAAVDESSTVSVADLDQAQPEATPSEGMAQVTSVSQLADVQPTDWAFQALQSLVERYGCIAGYPDGNFKGNRALTRYEFAAGVNACLDRVNELIAAGTTGLATKEDLETLKKLQEEFAAELATLRGRVDSLEARATELEKHQFSTTTKLNALVWGNITGAFAGDDVKINATASDPFGRPELRQAGRDLAGNPLVRTVTDDPEITFSDLGWLSFVTSFSGKDTLVTQLAFGNGESPANLFASAGAFNTFGTPFLDQTAGIQGEGNNVIIRELFYQFPIGDNIQVAVGPRVNWYRYFDGNRFNFFLVGTSTFNSNGSTLLNTLDRGSGAVAQVQLGKQLKFNLGYLGENTEFLPAGSGEGNLFNSSSDPKRGLFGGTWTATAELAYSPSNSFNVRLLYNRSRIEARGGQIGGVQGEPLQNGIVDAGPGFSTTVNGAGFVVDGGLKGSFANTFNINFDWLLSKGFGVFGRYSFGNVNLEPIDKSVNVQTFQAGLAFPDLGKQGALATFSASIPFDVVKGKKYFVSGYGDGGTEIDLELTYFYPLTSNIALVPAFYAIINPNNFSDNPTIFVGNVRAQFAF